MIQMKIKLLLVCFIFSVPVSGVQAQSLEGLYLCTCDLGQNITPKPYISPVRDCSLGFALNAIRFNSEAPTISGGAMLRSIKQRQAQEAQNNFRIMNSFGPDIVQVTECTQTTRVVTEAELNIQVLLKKIRLLESKIMALEKVGKTGK